MFYDVYSELCKQRGVSPTGAALEMGIARSTVSAWRNGGRTPSGAVLQKVADYFGVTTDHLLGVAAAQQGETDDRLIAFYGECRPYLTQDDIDDITLFMKIKAERKRQKGRP